MLQVVPFDDAAFIMICYHPRQNGNCDIGQNPTSRGISSGNFQCRTNRPREPEVSAVDLRSRVISDVRVAYDPESGIDYPSGIAEVLYYRDISRGLPGNYDMKSMAVCSSRQISYSWENRIKLTIYGHNSHHSKVRESGSVRLL